MGGNTVKSAMASLRPQRALGLTATVALGFTVTIYGAVLPAGANPQNGTITFGDVTIEQGTGVTTVTQSTERGAITWDSFNVGTGERVTFDQPSTESITLNNVRTAAPSNIQGQIDAPGKVWIVNPSGVLIGPEATIDVGGLMATTATISDENFAAGRDVFNTSGLGTVVNHGQIVAREGGVVLVAPDVLNTGQITVMGGDVQLHAGTAFTIDMEGDGLLGFTVEDDTAIAKSLTNTGTIRTDGGAVYMTAAAANAVVDSVIAADGVIEATTATQVGGEIILGGDGQIRVGGELTATKADTGGRIEVTAPSVAIEATARLDTSAPDGGGIIRIGDKGGVDPSEVVVVYEGAELLADVTTAGTAGEIEIWSDNATWFFGTASARAHAAGNAGFIEISSAGYLDYAGTVQITAPEGREGTLLFDPDDIFVVAAGVDDAQLSPADLNILLADPGAARVFNNPQGGVINSANAFTISAATLNSLGGMVLLQANNDIRVSADLSLGNQTLVLQAGGTIAIDANVTIASGDLTLQGLPANPVDLVRFADIDTPGTVNPFAITLNNGDFNVIADGNVELHGDITATNGVIDVVSANGFIALDSDAIFSAQFVEAFATTSTISNGTWRINFERGSITSTGPLTAGIPGINLVGQDVAIGSTLNSASDISITTTGTGNVSVNTVSSSFSVTPSTAIDVGGPFYTHGRLRGPDDITVTSTGTTEFRGPVASTNGTVRVEGADALILGTNNTLTGDLSGTDVILSTTNPNANIVILSPASVTATNAVTVETTDELNIGDPNPTITGLTNHVDQIEYDALVAPTINLNSSDNVTFYDTTFSSTTTTDVVVDAGGQFIVINDGNSTGIGQVSGAVLQTFDVTSTGDAIINENVSLSGVDITIDAQTAGTFTLAPNTFMFGNDVVIRASDFVVDGTIGSTSTRFIMTGTGTIGTGGLLDNTELGSNETSTLIVESESDLTIGTLALFDTNTDRGIPDLVLTAANSVIINGDVAGSFTLGTFGSAFNVSIGEQGGVLPSSVIMPTGRLGIISGTLDPFSLLEFYVAGDVTLNPTTFSAGETILTADSMTIDISGAFIQRNTLDPTRTTELPHGVGGAGAIINSGVTLTAATALELYGTVTGLTNDLARNGVTPGFTTNSAHQVNDCVIGSAPCNQLPIGVIDTGAVDEVTLLTIDPTTNDTDTDGDTLTVTQIGGVTATAGTTVAGDNGGLFTIDSSGQVSFDPNGDFNSLSVGASQATSTTYQVDDGFGGTSSATITVTVNGLNAIPTAIDVMSLTDENTSVTSDPMPMDPDSSDTPIITVINGTTVSAGGSVAGDNGGTFTLDPGGQTVTFTPGATVSGQLTTGDTLVTGATVVVSDGNGGTTTARIDVTVNGLNATPTATDVMATTDELTNIAADPMPMDTDIIDTPIITTINGTAVSAGGSVAGDNGGTFTLDPGGQTLTFTPGAAIASQLNAGDTLVSGATLVISDGNGGTTTARVDVTVTGLGGGQVTTNPPVAVSDTGLSILATPVNVAVLSNDSDPDAGDTVSLATLGGLTATPGASVAGTSGGIFTIESDGSVTFTPGSSFSTLQSGQTRTTSVTYGIVDTMGNMASATLIIDVTSQLTIQPPTPPTTPAIPDAEVVAGTFEEIAIVEPILEEDTPLTNRGNDEDWR